MISRPSLQQRQQDLLVRSTALRIRLGREATVLQQPLAIADRVQQAWRWAITNPVWPIGAAALLVVLRPRRALAWGLRLWSGWRLVRQIRKRLLPLL